MNDRETIRSQFSLSKKIILDWHDGIVSAMIQLEVLNRWWLVNLVAWDLNEKMKVYSLKKLSEDDSSHFFNLLKGQSPSWPIWNASPLLLSKFDELMEQIAEIINEKSSDHYLILTDDIDNGVHAIKAWTYGKKLSPPDVDEIVNMPVAQREYWYDFVVT